MPATVITTRRITRTMAVAGRTHARWHPDGDSWNPMAGTFPIVISGIRDRHAWMRPPQGGGLINMKEIAVTVGRAGRLSVHTLDERAHGMRGTAVPSCMPGKYRSL